MSKAEQKVVQYLQEARSMELALVRELQSQIAITPQGGYRTLLERHLRETRDHAERVRRRLRELDKGFNPLQVATGAAQKVISQAVAIGKAPLEVVRGESGEEKILKNAKDACASEALEIATYIALERIAEDVDDATTARLAASIRGDEEKMLDGVRRELPKLADAVVRAEVEGRSSFDPSRTGAADALRETAEQARAAARSTARQARKVPGVARAEGELKGAVASEEDLPIPGYDDLTAAEIVAKLAELSQVDLGQIAAYERRQQNRSTVLNKIESLRGNEPWSGYDEETVDEIVAKLRDADEDTVRQVREYESAHKQRASVLKATERQLASASS